MTIHAIKTEIHFTDQSKIMAEFLSNLVQYWYATFTQVEQQEAIPRTRAAWMESVDRLMRRDDIGDKLSNARDLHKALEKVGDFEIHQGADDVITIEYSSPLVLTLTPVPMAEADRPSVH